MVAAGVAKLADAQDLGSCSARSVGSSPSARTSFGTCVMLSSEHADRMPCSQARSECPDAEDHHENAQDPQVGLRSVERIFGTRLDRGSQAVDIGE